MSSIRVVVKGKARSRIALGVVTAYLRLHPNTTFKALKDVFPDSICPKAPVQFRSLVPLGVFQPLDVAQSLPEMGLAIAHYIDASEILNTSDGISIAVTKSWTQEAFEALSIAAAMHGIAVMMADEGEKWLSGTYELDFVDAHQPRKVATPAAPPPSKKLPDAHEDIKKPQTTTTGRCKLAYVSVVVLLALFGITALLHRSCCSGTLDSKAVVDTIVIEMGEICQPVEVKKDSAKKLQAAVVKKDSVKQAQAMVRDSPRKKKVRSAATPQIPHKVAAKKEKVEKVKPAEKGAKAKKAEKVDRVEKVKKVEPIKKAETVKKEEEAKKVEKVEPIKKVEEVDTVVRIEKVKKVEKVDTVKPAEQVKMAAKADSVKPAEQAKKVEKAEKVEKVKSEEEAVEIRQAEPQKSEPQPPTPKAKKRYTQKPLI